MNVERSIGAVLIATAALLIIAIWSVEVLPIQDYPEWVFQGDRCARLAIGAVKPDEPFRAHLFPPPPGSLAAASIAVCRLAVPADTAGRIVLTLTAGLFVFGWRRLCGGSHPLRWAGAVLTFNWFLLMGFLTFVLGLGALFLVMAWWRVRPVRASRGHHIALALAALFLYFAHPVALGLLVLYLVLERVLEPERWPGWQTASCALALVPAGALILLAGHAAPHGVEWYTSPVGAIVAWRPALLFFPRFVLSQETLPLSLLNLGAIVLTVLPGWALFHGRDPDRGRNVLLWFGVASFACAVIPISRIGEFYLVNVRFLPAGAAGIVAAVSSIRRNRSLELFVACFALLVSGIELERFRDFSRQAVPVARAVERMIAEQGATLVLARGFPEEFDKSASVILSGAVRPFLHVRRRADLTAEMPSPRTFETGLLERVSDPVLEERRDLEYALEHARSAEEASGFVRAHEASIGRLYERIVIIGSKQTRALLAGAFRAEYPVSDERTEALVLRKGS